MKYEYREAPEGINNPPTNHLKELLVLAGGLALIVVGCFLVLGVAADWLVAHLSPAAERKLAAMISIPVEDDAQTPDERDLQKLLDSLALRLPAVQGPLRLKIACSPQVNALALPGGTVLLFSGLVSRLRSENELAMVLGHEIGHFAARDHLKGLGRALVVMALTTSLFGTQDGVPGFMQNLVGVTSFTFSRAQEEAADLLGAHLVQERYGHAGGVVDFFKTMDAEAHLGRVSAWFSTHPASAARLETLTRLIEREGWPSGEVQPFNGAEVAGRCGEKAPR